MKRTHTVVGIAALSAAAAFGTINEAETAPLDLVAKAQGQELSVERLASLMATSTIPIQRDIAITVADFWVTYQLLGSAGADGDTLTDASSGNWWTADTTAIDAAMWQPLLDARTRALFDKISRTVAMPDTTNLEQKYAQSQTLAAQHILFMLPEGGMTQAKQDSVRRLADDVRRRVTAANFAALAKEYSTDPGSKDSGGSYAMFGPGTTLQMVPEFDDAVRKARPGEIAPGLVRSQYGFHIIRRHTLNEVRAAFLDDLVRANQGNIRNQYVTRLRAEWQVTLQPNALAKTRTVARNPADARRDTTVLAKSQNGDFTAGRLVAWIDVLPLEYRVREQLVQSPDSVAVSLLHRIVDQDLLAAQAVKEGVEIELADRQRIRTEFGAAVLYAMTGLRVDPRSLRDSATTPATRARLAASRVEAAIDRVFTSSGQDMIDVPPPVMAALRGRYLSRINSASVDRAVQRGIAIRTALDSSRAKASPTRR